MKNIDLHTHTTASDGTYSPSELIELALQKQLAAVAITDHDTTSGIEEAIQASKGEDIEVIPGIEISSGYDNLEIHIVGLFINPKDEDLLPWLKELRIHRDERNFEMLEKLNELGVKLTLGELEETCGGGTITRAHFAALMMKKGYVNSTNEAFDRYIGSGCKAYVPRKLPSCQKSIEMIRSCGGIAVMAHPLLYKVSRANLHQIAAELKKYNLTGIEAYYSTHTPAETDYVIKLAQDIGLLLSGGSDFHGANKKGLELGTGYGKLAVPYEILDKLKGALQNG